MTADITPEKARHETIENLVGMANRYRSDSGAYRIVMDEIVRREDWRRMWRKLFFAVLTAIGTGLIALVFAMLR